MTTYTKANTRTSQVVTTTGDDANGGCWGGQQSGNGVNRALDDDAHVVIDGSTVQCEAVSRKIVEFTSGYTVSQDDCGNGGWFNIASGAKAGSYAFGPITSVDTGNNRWTISNLNSPWNGITAGEALTGAMGGALATLGEATSRQGSYSTIYVKAGTYTLANNVHNSPGGPPEVQSWSVMMAFKDALGDHLANPTDRVILERGTTTDNGYMVKYGGNRGTLLAGFDIDCDDEWEGTNVTTAINCIVRNADGSGFSNKDSFMCAAYDCTNSGGTGYGFKNGSGMCAECYAEDCDNGFSLQSGFRNLAHGCGTGITIQNYHGAAFNVADDCTTGLSGSDRGASAFNMATNCTTGVSGMMWATIAYNNTTNVSGSPPVGGYVGNPVLQLTADPYEGRTGTPPDYRINDTEGGGAELENYAPKWAAGTIAGPQDQFAAILKSSGGGSTTVVTPGPVQVGM